MSKGGKRPGAGRPPSEPTKPALIRLTERQRAKYLELGGARWLKLWLNLEIAADEAVAAK